MVIRKTEPLLIVWKFQPYLVSSKETRVAGNWVHDLSCLHDENSKNFPKVWGAESCQTAEHMEGLRGRHPREGVKALSPLAHTLPTVSLPHGRSPGSLLRVCVCVSCLVMSNSLQPSRPEPTRPLCPWDSRQEHWSGLPFPSPKGTIEKNKVKSLSHARLFVTPWTVAYQAPPCIEFSR